MSDLRTTPSLNSPEVKDVTPPFSNFSFIEERFGFVAPIQRIFSQARTLDVKTLVIESIKSVGFSEEDDLDLKEAGFSVSLSPLIRLSFFDSSLKDLEELSKCDESNFIGYAILKQVPCGSNYRYIVFESVLKPSRLVNNYIHVLKTYNVNVGGRFFKVKGVLYCQQNGLTNVCAHIALRTCIAIVSPSGDVSYRKINKILADSGTPFISAKPVTSSSPSSINGLSTKQMLTVLDSLGIKYSLKQTKKEDSQGKDEEADLVKPTIPYRSYLYASIESGYPALLGFTFKGESAQEGAHIIPIFGHTFNEDAWVPNADHSYFKIGKDTRYIASESWVSTYICHDDNFGSYYCLPRQYISEDSVTVISIKPEQVKYDAIDAEAIAIDYLYTLVERISAEKESNIWIQRLTKGINELGGWIVLRTSFATSKEYIEHLRLIKGWDNKTIPSAVITELSSSLPNDLWIIEISLPELFPANRRKLGEIVLDSSKTLSMHKDLSCFVFARLLNKIYGLRIIDSKISLVSLDIADIDTHTELLIRANK